MNVLQKLRTNMEYLVENRDVVLLNTVHDVRLGNAADDGDYVFVPDLVYYSNMLTRI
jgi:hypothetical protein